MREYIEATWGWEEEWQQGYFARKFDPISRRIIQIDGQDTGVIAVEERDEEIFIALIEILPDFQGRGVGSALLRHTIQTAHSNDIPVTLQVLRTDTLACRPYERLGFVITRKEVDRYHMVCSPRN